MNKNDHIKMRKESTPQDETINVSAHNTGCMKDMKQKMDRTAKRTKYIHIT